MNLFNEYKLHYITKSECTLETYEVAIKQFYEFMNEQGFLTEDEIIKNADWSKAVMFRNTLVKKEYNPYSINNKISGLRSFFKFLLLTRRVAENPFNAVENVGTNGVEQKSSYLTEDEYKRLLKTIMNLEMIQDYSNYINYIIIMKIFKYMMLLMIVLWLKKYLKLLKMM